VCVCVCVCACACACACVSRWDLLLFYKVKLLRMTVKSLISVLRTPRRSWLRTGRMSACIIVNWQSFVSKIELD